MTTIAADRWAEFWSGPWILRDPVTLEPIALEVQTELPLGEDPPA